MAPHKKTLTGRYTRSNEALLRQRSSCRDDPRHVFYAAMLACDTYDAYEAAVQGIQVIVPNFKKGPINGHTEMLYARRSGWIVDNRC
jgi:hypothetical protein